MRPFYRVVRAERLLQVAPCVRSDAPCHKRISSLALDPSGKFLIGTQEEKNQVVVWSVDASSGKLTEVATAAAGTRPNWAVVDANDKFVYVSNGSSNIFKANLFPGSDNVSEYQMGSSGALTLLAGSPLATGHGPRGLIVVAR